VHRGQPIGLRPSVRPVKYRINVLKEKQVPDLNCITWPFLGQQRIQFFHDRQGRTLIFEAVQELLSNEAWHRQFMIMERWLIRRDKHFYLILACGSL
jgi:hypothetical protein